MRTVIFDLDYTLLDTAQFKQALAASVELSLSDWTTAYDNFVRDVGQFEPEAFLRGVSPQQRRQFDAVVTRTKAYLYPDSWLFLHQAVQAGYRVVVVTFGQAIWQQRKLTAIAFPSPITTLVTATSKLITLADYVESGTVIVDDRADELDAIGRAFPDTIRYWIRRHNGKYRNTVPSLPHQAVKNLTDIKL
ncbi:MAG: haloacid dehalogenase-like hydrolase [Candidatus Kerfeldbacteria bacterium]|nr:haloacid dehalogenase-like hydrolase [Candidatus Kerfeldbacteria bacterium]